jgi:hypothetical protein
MSAWLKQLNDGCNTIVPFNLGMQLFSVHHHPSKWKIISCNGVPLEMHNIRTSFLFLHSEGGPLPDEVVKLLEEAWKKAKVSSPHYAV